MTTQSIEDNVGNRFALSQRENRLIDVAYVILLLIFLATIYLVHLKSRIWIYDHKNVTFKLSYLFSKYYPIVPLYMLDAEY